MFRRWECLDSKRYYLAWVETDLLGDLILMEANGGLGTRLGAVRTRYMPTRTELVKQMQKINRERLAHHYKEVPWIWV